MPEQTAERIDLNTASPRELQQLGIDRAVSRRIVMERRTQGYFTSLGDLATVEGIDQILLDKLEGRVKVESRENAPKRGTLTFAPPDPEAVGADKPVTLYGPPDALVGQVVLRNDGDLSARAAFLRVEAAHLRGRDLSPLTALHIRSSVGPRQQRVIPLALQIDPTTPPGAYSGEVVAGDQRRQLLIHVTERLLVEISPSTMALPSAAGAKIKRNLVVHNGGNVPLTFGDLGTVALEELDLRCRIIRDTVRQTKKPTFDELVGVASDELKKHFGQLELLKIRMKNKPVTLQPGDTIAVELEIHTPKNLQPGRSYTARVRLHNAALRFTMAPGSIEQSAVEEE